MWKDVGLARKVQTSSILVMSDINPLLVQEIKQNGLFPVYTKTVKFHPGRRFAICLHVDERPNRYGCKNTNICVNKALMELTIYWYLSSG